MPVIKITLEAARVNAGLSVSEAAKKLGLKDAETLRNWEKGKTFPNILQLKKMEELYGIPYEGINFLIPSTI